MTDFRYGNFVNLKRRMKLDLIFFTAYKISFGITILNANNLFQIRNCGNMRHT